MIKIEKNIPIPPQTRQEFYPWKEMKVGDSFFTDIKAIRSSAYAAALRLKLKFRVAVDGKGFRVWRIK